MDKHTTRAPRRHIPPQSLSRASTHRTHTPSHAHSQRTHRTSLVLARERTHAFTRRFFTPLTSPLSPMQSLRATTAYATAPALHRARSTKSAPARSTRTVTRAGTTSIQFVKGQNETSVPEVKLTRSKDGTNGTAFFIFAEPDVFESGQGDITGMFLTDSEGEMSTVDVNAKFINGKPSGIEARYVMKTEADWNRFMRFMERYAEDNGLGFSKK